MDVKIARRRQLQRSVGERASDSYATRCGLLIVGRTGISEDDDDSSQELGRFTGAGWYVVR